MSVLDHPDFRNLPAFFRHKHCRHNAIDFDLTVTFALFGEVLGEPTATLTIYEDATTGRSEIWSVQLEGGDRIILDYWHEATPEQRAAEPHMAWFLACVVEAFQEDRVQSAIADEWVKAYGRVAA